MSSTNSSRTLSEADSKALLADFDVPFAPEVVAEDPQAAVEAAHRVGFPVVVKLNGDAIAHKTERGLVRLGLRDGAAVLEAAASLLGAATAADGEVSLLVAPMIAGSRELIAGVARDPQFGPTVMIGIGGVLAEALADVAIRLVPISELDAAEMLDDLDAGAILDAFRGEPEVDRSALIAVLVGLSRAVVEHPEIVSADLNPLIICDGRPVAVDALVEVSA